MFPEGSNSFMNEFNQKLENTRLLAIEKLVAKAKDVDDQTREMRQRQLLEALAMANLDLNDVQSILNHFGIDLISEKLPSLKELVALLIPVEGPEDKGKTFEVTQLKDVFVRPDKREVPVQQGGETPFRKKETIERSQMLYDFLKVNGIEVKPYHILEGQNTREMMRKESYVLFIIPSLDSMVLLCDEEGNVTFVIRDLPVDPKEYYKLSKDQLKAHPHVAPHIRWSDQETWENKILDFLTDPRTVFDKHKEESTERTTQEKVELIEDLEQLKSEVRAMGVKKMKEYHQERKKHPNWPYNPDSFFKGKGWISWPDLFGIEKVKLIEDLEQLKREVQEAGIKNMREFYEAREKHPNWPSQPYKLKNWINWPDLFGKEEVELINDLEELKREVRAASINSKGQYFEEVEKHPHWPKSPSQKFKDTGWISWPDLFGKEEVELINDLEELKREVRAAGIQSKAGYCEEVKNHPHWPSTPEKKFKDKGWISWFDFLGKVEILLIDNLEQLKKEVQEAGIRSLVQYNDEVEKNHPQWPTAPYSKFLDSGWVSWADLFGKEEVELINDLEELKREVREAGIMSSVSYSEEQKKHPRWPSAPAQKFKDTGWISWPDLFGKEEVELINDLEELKKEVQEAGIRSLAQYKEEQKKHPRWPSHPYQKFKDAGWISWFDFLGKVEIVLIDNLEQLKSEVRAASISSKDQYHKEIKNYPHWPHNPDSYFKKQGWVNWADLLGKNK